MLGTSLDLIIIGRKMLVIAVVLFFMLALAFFVRNKRQYFKYFVGLAIGVNFVYIIWRIGFTLPTMSLIAVFFGILLLLAEIFALIQTTTHRLMFLKDYQPEIKTLEDLTVLPTVDILIATYNEPISILENTVIGAVSQNYPLDKYSVYICDDGSRDEVRLLAEKYGAVWVTREEHKHAKAGNLNHCLEKYAKSELFVVLDADMIPKSNFLERTVGYFSDSKVALVQAPQVFYNPDPFQNNLQLFQVIPNEQDFFMREVLTRRAMFNAVLNVGSNAVFRRTAIEDIGMIPVGTITEDMATSMLLQAKGYKTEFVNETLAMGLSPETFSDYIVQRDRWCRGNIQVMKKWNPLFMRGLSLMQRLIYFDGVLYWFFGLQKLIYFIGPILFLLTGIPVLFVDVFTMLMFFVPTYYIATLVFTLFSHKSRTYIWAHIYESALAPYLTISALSELFFSKKKGFSVTPKGKEKKETYFAFNVALPHIILILVSLFAMGLGINKMLMDVNYMVPVYLVNIFWLSFNILGSLAAVMVCFEKHRFRAAERFQILDHPLLILENGQKYSAELIDISEMGCALSLHEPLENADNLINSDVVVSINDQKIFIPGTILRSRAWGKKIIILFDGLAEHEHSQLINFIFNNQQTGFGQFTPDSEHFVHVLRRMFKKLVSSVSN